MIIEGLLNVFFDFLANILGNLPNISWSADNNAWSTFLGFISVIMYLLPMDTIAYVLGTVISIILVRLVISVIKTLWDLLPFL